MCCGRTAPADFYADDEVAQLDDWCFEGPHTADFNDIGFAAAGDDTNEASRNGEDKDGNRYNGNVTSCRDHGCDDIHIERQEAEDKFKPQQVEDGTEGEGSNEEGSDHSDLSC
jgi:hypothetical protein